jgi:glutamyl-tRNA synthetase
MRVRFAPSPTGFLHIGNARTAIINYIISQKTKADMVLRIEDTDLERSSGESEASIIRDLKWLGITWSEGPDTGGRLGPYRQSERFEIYSTYTLKLIESGKAYFCYCTKNELEHMKKGDGGSQQFEYNGRCRNLSDEEIRDFKDQGRKPTVRFRVPENESVIVRDHIKGDIVFNSSNIGGDFIVVRSDGVPVYNYIVIIDDALMEITHVIRGEDHLSNTPKQILIAAALGLPVPEYAHLSLVLGPDRSKLSKRHGITSVDAYRSEGYLPEALINYLAMLGWSTENGEEILAIDDIVNSIELASLAKSAAIFDFQKLRWMNGNYIRSMPLDNVMEKFMPYIEKAGYGATDTRRLRQIIDLVRGNCEVLSDITCFLSMMLDKTIAPDTEARAMLDEADSMKIIEAANEYIDSAEWNLSFKNLADFAAQKSGAKGKKLFMTLRAIITGRLKGPDMEAATRLIGRETVAERIKSCCHKYRTRHEDQ